MINEIRFVKGGTAEKCAEILLQSADADSVPVKNEETLKKLEAATANPIRLDGNAHVGKYELTAKSTREYIQGTSKNSVSF